MTISQHKAAGILAHYLYVAMEGSGTTVTPDMRDEIENAVAAFDHASTPQPDPVRASVVALMEAMAGDKKIEAIKQYRSLTGDGLLPAKTAVENIMDRLKKRK